MPRSLFSPMIMHPPSTIPTEGSKQGVSSFGFTGIGGAILLRPVVRGDGRVLGGVWNEGLKT